MNVNEALWIFMMRFNSHQRWEYMYEGMAKQRKLK